MEMKILEKQGQDWGRVLRWGWVGYTVSVWEHLWAPYFRNTPGVRGTIAVLGWTGIGSEQASIAPVLG